MDEFRVNRRLAASGSALICPVLGGDRPDSRRRASEGSCTNLGETVLYGNAPAASGTGSTLPYIAAGGHGSRLFSTVMGQLPTTITWLKGWTGAYPKGSVLDTALEMLLATDGLRVEGHARIITAPSRSKRPYFGTLGQRYNCPNKNRRVRNPVPTYRSPRLCDLFDHSPPAFRCARRQRSSNQRRSAPSASLPPSPPPPIPMRSVTRRSWLRSSGPFLKVPCRPAPASVVAGA